MTFSRGDRVRLRPEYWTHFRKASNSKPDRIGTVIGTTDWSVRVVWDGTSRTTVQYYEPRFVERVDERDYVI